MSCFNEYHVGCILPFIYFNTTLIIVLEFIKG